MAPRSLFFLAIAIASAAMGASFALTKRLEPQAATPLVQTAQQPAPLPVATSPQPVTSPLFAPPSSTTTAIANGETAAPIDELMQVKAQIRRAIRERNTVLLRSLLQAGSVREMLRTTATPDQMNLDNLDASTWKLLEKAVAHRCRQPQSEAGEPQSDLCFE